MKARSVDELKMCFTEHTAAEYTDTRLHKKKTAWLLHKTGRGKSMLQGAWGRLFCRRYECEQYISGKSLDPLGMMTKHGEVDSKGALMMADLAMKSLMDKYLDVDELKGLLQVYETAHIPGRYHQGIIPAGMPRSFSANLGKVGTRDDAGAYFERENMPGLAAVARGDLAALKACSDDDIAVARRCIVFVVPDELAPRWLPSVCDCTFGVRLHA